MNKNTKYTGGGGGKMRIPYITYWNILIHSYSKELENGILHRAYITNDRFYRCQIKQKDKDAKQVV